MDVASRARAVSYAENIALAVARDSRSRLCLFLNYIKTGVPNGDSRARINASPRPPAASSRPLS